MGFNLDFSGWKDAREAQAQSILNQAQLSANVIANKYNMYNKLISGLTGALAMKYGNSTNASSGKSTQDPQKIQRSANTGLAVDPMQVLSASNQLTGDSTVDSQNAALIGRIMESGQWKSTTAQK